MIGLLERWGRRVRLGMAEVGYGTRFFLRLCSLIPAALARPRLVIDQLHFIGNRSLSIILVSGLFVGFVLGLQGYYTLQRYGSAEALGLLVALSLVRELGPVVAALLFAGRAGTSLTAEVGRWRHALSRRSLQCPCWRRFFPQLVSLVAGVSASS